MAKFNFSPSEQELLRLTLRRAIEGPLLDHQRFIKECNLYTMDPQSLFKEGEEGIVYVFTKLKKKSIQGTRIDRRVAEIGTWKERDKPKTLTNGKDEVIGYNRGFLYTQNSSKSIIKTSNHYRMREYSLHSSMLLGAKYKDFVLCKIKKYLVKKRRYKHGDRLASTSPKDDDIKLGIICLSSDSSLSPADESPKDDDTKLGIISLSSDSSLSPAKEPTNLKNDKQAHTNVPSSLSPPDQSTDENQTPPVPQHILPPKNRQIIGGKVITFQTPTPSYYGPITMIPTPPSGQLFSYPVPSDAPSPSTDLQPEPTLIPSLDQSLMDLDDDDCDLDWPTCFAEELKQFQMQPLEESPDGKMLPNSIASWIMEDMLFY